MTAAAVAEMATPPVNPAQSTHELMTSEPERRFDEDQIAELAKKTEPEIRLAAEAEAELARHGGIPRVLARELGERGCAELVTHLKMVGGVGLACHPRGTSAFCRMSATGLVGVTWEDALRHELPFILRGLAQRIADGVPTAKSSFRIECLETKLEAHEHTVRHLKGLLEQTLDREQNELAEMERLEEENERLQEEVNALKHPLVQ